MIYLDYAATTPICETALHVFTEVSKNYYGNANSLHDAGTNAKDILEHCRGELAAMIGADSKTVYFTSGGTESNVLAVKNLLQSADKKGKHIITTVMEHSSLLDYFAELEQIYGYSITYLPVCEKGTVSLEILQKAITNKTVLVSIQHANSETGIVQPVTEIGKLLDGKEILFHSDCVQTFGKLPIDVKAMHVDSISISSHKICGPKGVGAVYINPAVSRLAPRDFRPGTADVPGIAAFVTAAEETCKKRQEEQKRLAALRTYFLQQLENKHPDVEIISGEIQLPQIIGILTGSVQGDYAMLEFNRAGIAISTGSACSIGMQEHSKTILSLGKSKTEAKQFIRLSTGSQTTEAELEQTAEVLHQIIMNYQKGAAAHGQ